MPQVVNLRTGQNYYRFASSNKPVANQRGGGWWLDFENYKKIERFAQSNQYSMRDSARLMLALPIDWTRVDRLVCAMLAKPIKHMLEKVSLREAPGTVPGFQHNIQKYVSYMCLAYLPKAQSLVTSYTNLYSLTSVRNRYYNLKIAH